MKEKDNIINLTITLMVTFISFVLVMALVFALLFLLLKPVFDQRWFELLFYLAILSAPFVLFQFVFVVFAHRSRQHPSMLIEVISKLYFAAGMVICLLMYVLDFVSFFRKEFTDIQQFRTFDLRFLAYNIFGLFAIAILQALTTNKEKSWMDKQ